MQYEWNVKGWLARSVAFALGLVALVAALLFSLVLFAVLLTAALLVFGYAWWRLRSLHSVRNSRSDVIDIPSREVDARDRD